MQHVIAGSWRLCTALEWLQAIGHSDVIVQLEPGHPDVEAHATDHGGLVVVNAKHFGISRNTHTALMRARQHEHVIWVPDDAKSYEQAIEFTRRDLLRCLGQWCFKKPLAENMRRVGLA